MGPRRVGKTVMLHHGIADLLQQGVPPPRVAYFAVDHPLYNGLGLEDLLDLYAQATGTDITRDQAFVFFDEIQYLKNWEIHLKALFDSYPKLRPVVSGSAAAALRLKSIESGAGRFVDFLLPPLTFVEYLELVEPGHERVRVEGWGAESPSGDWIGHWGSPDLPSLNRRFLHYLNFGGYPEVVLSPSIQEDPARFIKEGIVDKVLLRDLPSLYGIDDIQELNYLFTTLAFNTGNEVTLKDLSSRSGTAKNTIKRYIEYLEAAFLLRVVHRLDRTGKKFKRAPSFKVYLTNPSIRSALFAPIEADSDEMGHLVETAIFSQWFHSQDSTSKIHFARWKEGKGGEVDMVYRAGSGELEWAVEAKWSDRYVDRPGSLKSAIEFCRTNGLKKVLVTTVSRRAKVEHAGIQFEFCPASEYCLTLGVNHLKAVGPPHPSSS